MSPVCPVGKGKREKGKGLYMDAVPDMTAESLATSALISGTMCLYKRTSYLSLFSVEDPTASSSRFMLSHALAHFLSCKLSGGKKVA